MGLFSDKIKTYVGTSVSPMIDEKMLPNSVLTGSLKAIFQESSLVENVIEDLVHGLGIRAGSAYYYGRHGYFFGTPAAHLKTSTVGMAEVQQTLNTLEGKVVQIDYLHLGEPNILHVGWLQLVRDYGYDQATNKLGVLSAQLGTDVFLHDLVVVIPHDKEALYSGFATDLWGTPPRSLPSPTRPGMALDPSFADLVQHTPVEVSSSVLEDGVRMEFAWVGPAGKIKKDSLFLGNSEFNETKDFFQVSYRVDGAQRFWMYEAGKGTYPALDALVDTPPVELGTFLPFVHLRSQKQSLNANKELDKYKHSVRMAEKLGFDYDEVLDNLNENPQIGDIEQAYIGMLVPVNTELEIERRYLFDFFDGLYDAGLGDLQPITRVRMFYPARVNRAVILVQDAFVKNMLASSGIYKMRVADKFGEPGTHTSGFVQEDNLTSYHYFRRQLDTTVYDELRVYNLQLRYQVRDEGTTTVAGKQDGKLLVPIDYAITKKYNLPIQEELYARSLRLVANSLVEVSVAWYEQGWFATALQVIGVLMIVFDGGFTASLSAAIAIGVGAVIEWVVITVLIKMAVQYVFQLFVKLVGIDVALVLAVVAAVYGGYEMIAQGVQAASPMAKDMLQAALNLVQASAAQVQSDLLDLQQEFQAFKDASEEQLKLLEKAQELLENDSKLTPMILFGESPQAFYQRTVHSGNVGTIGFQAIETYVDRSLKLPTISDTLGGLDYGL